MADISVAGGTRPKTSITNALTVGLLVPTPVINDGTDTSVQYFQLENVSPDPATLVVNANVTTGSPTIVGTAGDFTEARVGDAVSGTSVAVGSRIIAVATDGSSITVDLNATGTATENVTVTKNIYDLNVFALVSTFSASGSTLTLNVKVYKSEGANNIDSDGDGVDNSTYTDYGSALLSQNFTVNLDTLLSNQRVPRTA